MLFHCLKCRKNTESRDPKVVRTKNVRIMLLPKCAVCNSNVPVLNDISKVNSNVPVLNDISKVNTLF